ncbi:glucose-1-phosphate thymidylyltransferase [Phototrophicus methaneseepsis]|uniref:Glucose-1-phosphate thymidylyltransferase n=1 Tax=Phototrophicus methaneseepsis TaxID=2710758 RepID=A0A7S8ED76_9CHLR|nr:glucose-1-phosphate thymidylyltransferase [Phototrophicus methaneseepsis]QPC84789.1 glucose-1-phosphate thymidylyltransferase [Phototrophicus methaneseepsis]
MKAIILAAGMGTRLRPVTLTMPKPLVPVANKRLIEYALDVLKDAGLTDIGVVVNDMDSPIREQLGTGEDLGVEITYIAQEERNGLAHAISLCKDFVGDSNFCVFLGDVIFQDHMQSLLKNFESSDYEAQIALGEVPDPTRFGIAVIEDDLIKGVVEKPKDPPSNLAIAGIYLFRPSIWDAIAKIKPSWRNELEITDAIQELITAGHKVAPYVVEGWWIDAGKPDPIVTANQLVLESLPYSIPPEDKCEGNSDVSHRVIVGENSKIIDSVVRGPVIIGDNTIIRNSYIGPYTSLGDDVVIEGSEIEYSIVMNNCEIRNISGRIDRSLLAHNARVTRTEQPPQSHRFVLAENSYVEM